MIRVPRDYQRALTEFALQRPRSNGWAGTGTGKTSSGIDLFDCKRLFGEANRCLVVTTKRIARDVWPKEVRKWENFDHLSVAAAIGTADERLVALRRNADITTINFDNFPWLIDKLGGPDNWPRTGWDFVICDESSKIKSLRIALMKSSTGKAFWRSSGGSSRAERIARVAHKHVRSWINYTAKPAANGIADLWGQAWFLDAGARLGRSYTAFERRWFSHIRTGKNAWETILTPTPNAQKEITDLLSDISITIEAKDYFDLPPTIYNEVLVPLPPAAWRHYREMEKLMFTEIDDFEIEAFNGGAKTMKCRQLASGAAYVDDKGNWVEVHDAKLEALAEIIPDEPMIVAFQFKSDLARLKARFPHAVFFDDKPTTLARFIRGEIALLLLHPASAAHGIDEMQTFCRHICFFSQTWNLDEFQQTIERVGATRQVQAGFYREVYVHLLIGENTIEEQMIERCKTKATVQDSIINAMKKRG